MTIRKTYIIWLAVLLAIEFVIARYSSQYFVRGFLGDVLSVIVVYCFLRSFFSITTLSAGVAALLIAIVIELLQLLEAVTLFNIRLPIVQIVLGSTFDPLDFLAYTLGFILIFTAERIVK